MRKGQAAMEFLMTYGWAILVVLAAIAALAYFGVLSPDRFFPDKCVIQGGGLTCAESKVSSSTQQIQFSIENSGGTDLNNVTVFLTPGASSACAVTPFTDAPTPMANRTVGTAVGIYVGTLANSGRTYVLNFTCISGFPTSNFQGTINVTYVPNGATLTQLATGSLTRKVSP